MKARYHSMQTANEKVVIKNSEAILAIEPNTGKLAHSGFTEELCVQFKNYILETENPEVIKYMDDPKRGCGSLWKKIDNIQVSKGKEKNENGKI